MLGTSVTSFTLSSFKKDTKCLNPLYIEAITTVTYRIAHPAYLPNNIETPVNRTNKS